MVEDGGKSQFWSRQHLPEKLNYYLKKTFEVSQVTIIKVETKFIY